MVIRYHKKWNCLKTILQNFHNKSPPVRYIGHVRSFNLKYQESKMSLALEKTTDGIDYFSWNVSILISFCNRFQCCKRDSRSYVFFFLEDPNHALYRWARSEIYADPPTKSVCYISTSFIWCFLGTSDIENTKSNDLILVCFAYRDPLKSSCACDDYEIWWNL